MTSNLAVKISDTVFAYPLLGFDMRLLYHRANRNMVLTNEDGELLKVVEQDEDLDFEDFKLVSPNIWLNMVDQLS